MVRVSIAAALALAALTSLAAAQQAGKMPAHVPEKEDRPLFDERKYKAASERIPEQKASNDPWAGAREPTAPPTAAATAPPSAKGRKKSSE